MFLYRLLFLLFLSSCGFSSLDGDDNIQNASRIKIVVFGSGDLEYDLSQSLKKSLGKKISNDAIYRLEVHLDRKEIGFATSKYSNSTRERINFSARYQLIDINSGTVLLEDNDFDSQSYDISFESEYSNFVAEKYSEQGLVHIVAGEISTRVKAFLLQREAVSDAN